MSSQHPGADNRPGPEPRSENPPAPVTAPYAAEPTPGQAPGPYAGQAPAAGWGAPYAPHEPGPAQPAAGWGAPGGASRGPSADKPWTLKRGLAVGGAAAVLAIGAGVGVYAFTSNSAAANGTAAAGAAAGHGPGGQGMGSQGMPGSPQGGSAGGRGQGQGGPGGFTAGGMGGGLSAAVHAEYVILEGSTYTTMAEQLGTVTEVSATSVTVKSSDGFTRSYGLGSNVVVSNLEQRRQQAGGTGTQLSVADIVAGGTVRIVAAKDGSNYTASSVMVVAATATGQSN